LNLHNQSVKVCFIFIFLHFVLLMVHLH
jgi:hypothetical protein